MLQNIPFELQQLAQWVVATGVILPDGTRDKTPLNPRTGYKADVTEPSTWGTFTEAQNCGYSLVGFVLSKDDPYCIIDLDDPRLGKDKQPEPNPVVVAERMARHEKILNVFETYSELSQSGNGVHIICRGAVPHGVRKDKVEVYSDSRYMVCTGNVYKPFPIVDCQDKLDLLYGQMNADQPVLTELTQVASGLTDEQVYNMASTAENSTKFMLLWLGQWQGKEWPSQSEADFALMSMLAFYSRDNAQCIRLFRWSGLGQRPKAQRDDYFIGRYGMLNKIRAKELPPIDFSKLIKPHANEVRSENDQAGIQSDKGELAANQPAGTTERTEVCAGESDPERTVKFPPGFIGNLAEYFFASAIRPVSEIALVAALALTAGVVGRTYNISGSGLNQYLILIAKTGSGKEGAASGIDRMIAAVRATVPSIDQFIGPGAFASGQGLVRVLDKQECFVSVLGEFGLTLQALCDPKANTAVTMLKKVLLDVYAKSGYQQLLRPSAYSETEKNTRLVQAPNITILGESTPESFYDGLDANAIAQGLVPRFSIFEYDGPRPDRNPNAFAPPTRELVQEFIALISVAISAQQNRSVCPVQIEPAALALLDKLDLRATEEINTAKHPIINELWNRAHLKALKLSALVAVGVNPHAPIVNTECAEWAIAITERDITKLIEHFAAGDIGHGDARLESDLRRAIEDYLKMSPKTRREYKVLPRIAEKDVIPMVYLKRRLRNLSSFRIDRRGANAALGAILKGMCESGELQQVNQVQCVQEFGVQSSLYVRGNEW